MDSRPINEILPEFHDIGWYSGTQITKEVENEYFQFFGEKPIVAEMLIPKEFDRRCSGGRDERKPVRFFNLEDSPDWSGQVVRRHKPPRSPRYDEFV